MNAPRQPRKKPATKPAKPYADFPMGWHSSGYWCKRILGQLYYFGERWDTSGKSALADFNRRSPYLYAGQNPDEFLGDGYTLKQLLNDYLAHKEAAADRGDISRRSFTDYLSVCKRLMEAFGPSRDIAKIGPSDFKKLLEDFRVGKSPNYVGKSPNYVGNFVAKVKAVFHYGVQTNKLERTHFGLDFKRPSRRAYREHRRSKPAKLFSVDDLKQTLANADTQFRAITLLAINTGFGNADIGRLTLADVDLEKGWHDYGRVKTGIERRCKLWPETVEAINQWLEEREHQTSTIFNQNGRCWHTEDCSNRLSIAFRKIAPDHLTFYCLRHSFETIAGDSRDQVAVDHCMGHCDNSMAGVYRERIDDQRLIDLSEFVRQFYLEAIQAK